MWTDTSTGVQTRVCGGGVAVGARSFDMTRGTCANIAFGVECVVVGAFRHIFGSGTDPSFGMKTTVFRFVVPQARLVGSEGVAVGDTASLMTIHTEGLRAVATAAGWIVTSGTDGVDQYPVVRMNFKGASHAIVALETIAFLVALGTVRFVASCG